MSDPIADPSDLALLIGSPVDDERAALLIALAQQLCESIVSPLPAAAQAVVLAVAARAFANPLNVQSQAEGPYSASYGAGASGGLYLSTQDRATLKRLAGRGGAFTFDTMPTTAGQNLPWWDVNVGGQVPDWDNIP